MSRFYKKVALICVAAATGAVLSAMPVSVESSATSGVVLSVDQAQARVGHPGSAGAARRALPASCQRTKDCDLERRRRPLRLAASPTASAAVKGEQSDIRMTGSDNWKKTVRLNKLLGMWAAEKMGMTGRDAEAYSDALAVGTLDPECSDVFSKIRWDFDVAGVVQSDEQILRVMNELTLQAGNQMPVTRGGAPDALAVMLARKLKSQ